MGAEHNLARAPLAMIRAPAWGHAMTPEVWRMLLSACVVVAVVLLLKGQCRKPRWWPGRFFIRVMNASHSALTDWGLAHVPLQPHFTLLDVGCGGGRTIDKLATIASAGRIHGIDYSAASVAVARRTNKRWIEAGRVEIRQGSVSQLPFPEGTFDVVSAVETHYYWPDPAADVREILRVLKPGGRLILIAETYRGQRFDALYRPTMKLLRATYLTEDEHRELLSAAGFAEVVVSVEASKGWICVVGRRPAQDARLDDATRGDLPA